MTPDENHPNSDDALEQSLRDALTPPPIPDAWTEEMLASIRAIPETREAATDRPRVIRWPIAAALAAAAALLLLTLTLRPNKSPVVPSTPAIASADINQDGAINILDAFTLAAALQRGETNPAWDVNADGLVNEGDTRAIATQAVQLTTAPSPTPPPPAATGTSS